MNLKVEISKNENHYVYSWKIYDDFVLAYAVSINNADDRMNKEVFFNSYGLIKALTKRMKRKVSKEDYDSALKALSNPSDKMEGLYRENEFWENKDIYTAEAKNKLKFINND